jgi:CBS domain-containing protein
VNVVIAAVLFVLVILFQGLAAVAKVQLFGGNVLANLLWVNVMLVVFNLLPAFPMDGGRVLRALLARRMEYSRATRTAANVGQMMAFLFGLLGLLGGNPWLLFIALFVYMGAEAEAQMVQVQTAFRGLPVRQVMVTQFATLGADEPLSRAVQILLSGTQQDFPVIASGSVVGMLMRRDLLSALHDRGLSASIAEAMRRDVPTVESSAPLDETFQRMQSDDLSAIPVTEAERLAGLITMENIAEFLMVRSALDGAPATAGEATEREATARERPTWSLRRGTEP